MHVLFLIQKEEIGEQSVPMTGGERRSGRLCAMKRPEAAEIPKRVTCLELPSLSLVSSRCRSAWSSDPSRSVL